MLTRQINFYAGALMITIIGAAAAFAIVRAANITEYAGAAGQDVPTLSEALGS